MVVQICLFLFLFFLAISLSLICCCRCFTLSSFKWKSTSPGFLALHWSLRSAKCISEGEQLIDHPFVLVFWWPSEILRHLLILSSSIAGLWKAILEIGDVLQYYDPAKRFPSWGFGARPIDGPVSHCFNLNGSTYQPEVFCYLFLHTNASFLSSE